MKGARNRCDGNEDGVVEVAATWPLAFLPLLPLPLTLPWRRRFFWRRFMAMVTRIQPNSTDVAWSYTRISPSYLPCNVTNDFLQFCFCKRNAMKSFIQVRQRLMSYQLSRDCLTERGRFLHFITNVECLKTKCKKGISHFVIPPSTCHLSRTLARKEVMPSRAGMSNRRSRRL